LNVGTLAVASAEAAAVVAVVDVGGEAALVLFDAGLVFVRAREIRAGDAAR
jgi:hypothetical protein